MDSRLSPLLATLILVACSRPAPEVADAGCPWRLKPEHCDSWQKALAEEEAKLGWIDPARAEADADEARSKSDFRLWGVYGYSIDVPGADDGVYIPNGCGLKMLEGTSDAPASMDLIRAAREYAHRYNRRMLSASKCWSLPPARTGVKWSGGSYDGRHSLSFGVPDTMYDYLELGCDGGPVRGSQIRVGATPGTTRISLGAGSMTSSLAAALEAPDASLKRTDFAYMKFSLPVEAPLWQEFADTGRMDLDGQEYGATSDDERSAIQTFVAACTAAAAE